MGITEFSDHKTVTDYIKDVETKANSAQADIGDIDDLETTADTLVGAINEVNEKAIAAAELPAVTSADNGKVLTVSEGAWDKAMPVSDVFTAVFSGITDVSQSQSSDITCDKTAAEIYDAFAAGKYVQAKINGYILPLTYANNSTLDYSLDFSGICNSTATSGIYLVACLIFDVSDSTPTIQYCADALDLSGT